MKIQERREDKWQILEVTGRVDSLTAPQLDAAFKQLIDDGSRWLGIDLSGVEYLSSAGLRVLLATLKAVRAMAGDLQLYSPRDNVRSVLEISGFSDLFTIGAPDS
jgi:anti-sigma B factor antagonist